MSAQGTGSTEEVTIDLAEVRRIAALSHLELGDDELARITEELGAILRYVRQLETVDVSGVAPTAYVMHEQTTARADEPRSSLDRARFLAGAPDASEEGFVVPAFVDEG